MYGLGVLLVLLVCVNRSVSELNNTFKRCTDGYCTQKYMCPDSPTDPQNQGIIILRNADVDECGDLFLKCCKREASSLPRSEVPIALVVDPKEHECGVRNKNGRVYAVDNDNYAKQAEYPWVVAILKKPENSKYPAHFIGGGTLIHPKFVITAAHILETTDHNQETVARKNLIAKFGAWNLSRDDALESQEIDVDDTFLIHPEYSRVGLLNDIALLLLKQEVVYKNYIAPLCLPSPTDVFDDQTCVACGWGKEFETEEYSQILKRVLLPVIPRKRCKQLFAATRLGSVFRLHKSVLCAGGEGNKDTCHGDGGSALACKTASGSYVLAGIVSWGLSCYQEDVPGAYVNVARFVDWIQSTIDQNEM